METAHATMTAMRRENEILGILNPEKIGPLMDVFCRSMGIASAIIDLEGEILVSANWQPVCADFHRLNYETGRRCRESDTFLCGKIIESEEFHMYTCRNGLTEAAAPIRMRGRHIANLFIGQFFTQQPNLAPFRDQARLFDFDEAAYLEALVEVPVIAADKVLWIVQYLVSFAELLGDMGLQGIEQKQAAEKLRASEVKARRMEEHLRQSQKLETIGTLAGGFVHDFNNILGAIIGYAQLTLSGPALEDSAVSNLEQILHAADRAICLVKQISWLSKKTGDEFKPVQLAYIVKDVAAMLRAASPATMEIRLALDEGAAMVLADPVQLHQMLVNLCMNAAQAMGGHGGLLFLELRPVLLEEPPPGIHSDGHSRFYLRLRVQDTGPGIPVEIMDRIFEPFFTTRDVGEGMGLTVAHGIIKRLGGTITAENAENGGALFTVLLPAVEEPVADGHVSSAVLPGGNARILFVDDEHCLADVGEQMLVSLGYSVTTKHNGIEAIEGFIRDPHAFDMVITDQTMPGMTGLELARRLRSIKSDLPVILCTGYAEAVPEETVLEPGIRVVLHKPVKKQQLADAIRQAFEKPIKQLV